MASSERTTSGGFLATEHDQRLADLLKLISHNIEAAQSKQELIDVINQVNAFAGPLRYSHTRHKILAAVSFTVAMVCGLFLEDFFAQQNITITPVVIISGVCFLGLVIYMWRKSVSIHASAERLYLRALLFDNNLQELAYDLPSLEQDLFASFFEFNRGNYSRKITRAYKGHYQGNTHTFDYHFYHFHYVDERTVTERDSKGNTQTRTVYHHYDRYGITLNFLFTQKLAIARKTIDGFKGVRYKPSSNQFNRLFKVTTETEMIAARFLKPAVVLACEEAAERFKSLNLEFNRDAKLCMSFDNNNVISGSQQYDFSSPNDFIREVEKENPLPELHSALEFIHTLMVYSDNNFKKDNE